MSTASLQRLTLVSGRLIYALLLLTLSACSGLAPHEPLQINLAGIEPLPSQGMEWRFAVQLRVKNPNDSAIDFNGIALDLEVNQQPLASGVSDQSGQVPRFGEVLISVPVSISAFSIMRQAWAAEGYKSAAGLPYRLHGKLAGGLLGGARFNDSGTLNWPAPGAR